MTPFETLLVAAYFVTLAVLALYGAHRYYLVYVYMKHGRRVPPRPAVLRVLPRVTVQLPIYNEMYVVERLIDAVCRFDYPRDLLQIQVLDDSTDETRQIVALAVRRWAERGLDIVHVTRSTRVGYKAGALANGLKTATGAFIAVFDADFVPSASFLVETLPHFADARVGMVQTRWGHLNGSFSLLTRLQAILLDGHFVLEHGGRHRAGCFFNFNGTAGVWRREAIERAGGWQHDTLTEDLDLSYRAQMRGWRFVFLPDVVAPAEVPVEMNAFKSQQHRWAKGSVQTCRKLLPAILRAPLPLRVRLEAFFHLTANFNAILMVLVSILILPAMLIRLESGSRVMLLLDVPLFCAATLSFVSFYGISQREVHPDWRLRLLYIPFALAVGIGLCINNSRAVLEALFDRRGGFVRTPKYGVRRRGDDWVGKRYQQSWLVQPIIELGLGMYFTGAVVYAASLGLYPTLPFLVLFQVGYLYMGIVSLAQQLLAVGVTLEAQVARE